MTSWKYTWSSVNIGGVRDPGSQMGEERRMLQSALSVQLPLRPLKPCLCSLLSLTEWSLQPHDPHCTAHLMVP